MDKIIGMDGSCISKEALELVGSFALDLDKGLINPENMKESVRTLTDWALKIDGILDLYKFQNKLSEIVNSYDK